MILSNRASLDLYIDNCRGGAPTLPLAAAGRDLNSKNWIAKTMPFLPLAAAGR